MSQYFNKSFEVLCKLFILRELAEGRILVINVFEKLFGAKRYFSSRLRVVSVCEIKRAALSGLLMGVAL